MRYLILSSLLLLLVSSATADQPDIVTYSTATFTTYGGDAPLVLRVNPDGSGAAFTEARDGSGSGDIDGRITLTMRDPNMVPVIMFPAEDLWLESDDGGLAVCWAGSIAEEPTDSYGETTWTLPLRAGGHSQAMTRVSLFSNLITSRLPLHYNSPDIDGDGVVGLLDLTIFTADYYSGYTFRSDFEYNQALGLTDLTRFTQAYGAECP